MQHEIVDHVEILDRQPVRSTIPACFIQRHNVAIMRLDAGEMIGGDIGIGENRLAQRTHEAQLVARAGIGGDAAERGEIGNHRIRLQHHPLIDFIDVAAMADPGIRRRNLQVTRGKRDKACLPRQ